MHFYLIAAIILAILAVIFGLQNAETVTVKFLVWQFEGSRALVLLMAFAFGAVSSLLAAIPRFLRYRRKLQELSHPPKEKQKDENS